MTRKDFIRACGLLGISLPFSPVINACKSSDDNDVSTNNTSASSIEKVIIVGAGVAGMTAGYLLNQQGIDFQIIEASPNYGGRIKHTRSFSNFPISLGGEWIHVDRSILEEAVNDSSIDVSMETQPYVSADQYGYYDGNELSISNLGASGVSEDLKFVGSSWLDFFETYILPSVENKIIYNTPIQSIDYSGASIIATSNGNNTFTADRIIVTVPLKMIQNNTINFNPELSSSRQNAISSLNVWSGFKAFFKFDTKFYPTFLEFEDSANSQGQRLYYDASYAQNTTDNILGLFSVGQQAEVYQALSETAQRDYILDELDTVFGNNMATDNYIDHVVQNWNDEPFIGGAYMTDQENWQLVRRIGRSVDDKLFFAGCAYTTGEDWSSVHTAIRSAVRAIEELVS
ncbi:flavin monoamine oxidase family protein [Winogradskyella poriferorum]|uniref:flavin monoamine oxidase family protein n=1 Tax=Winogradskyella poriferorum TaxID=307627 RepID=UPI003D646844